jgi:hypothetical protein
VQSKGRHRKPIHCTLTNLPTVKLAKWCTDVSTDASPCFWMTSLLALSEHNTCPPTGCPRRVSLRLTLSRGEHKRRCQLWKTRNFRYSNVRDTVLVLCMFPVFPGPCNVAHQQDPWQPVFMLSSCSVCSALASIGPHLYLSACDMITCCEHQALVAQLGSQTMPEKEKVSLIEIMAPFAYFNSHQVWEGGREGGRQRARVGNCRSKNILLYGCK